MKILLTGCFGFIGSNLLIELLNNRYEVIGIDNLSNCHEQNIKLVKKQVGKNWSNLKFYKADIRSSDVLSAIVYHDSIDAIIHLAAQGSVPRSFKTPVDTFTNNIIGFANIMQLAERFGISKVVYASSSSVYGVQDTDDDFRHEGLLLNPISPYALSKANNEQFAYIYGREKKIATIGLRFFNVYGPMQLSNSDYSAVIPKFINDDVITINGDGSIIRDFTFVSDIVDGIILALESKITNNIMLNLGTGMQTSIAELAKKISVKLNKNINNKDPRSNEIKTSYASIALTNQILGYNPKVLLDDGLDKTIAFYKDN